MIVYEKIIDIDSDDKISKFARDQVEKLVGVREEEKQSAGKKESSNILVDGFKKQIMEDDYAKLILPKKIVPSKSKQLVESFKEVNKKKSTKDDGQKKQDKKDLTSKPLIQEI